VTGPTYQGIRRRSAESISELRSRSLAGAEHDLATIADMQCFCLFVGYARSGHTVLASLLDAHPDAVVANELDAVGFFDAGFRREQLLHMILSNAYETAKAGNAWTGYDYAVPDGWQGRVRTASVMGDKKAAVTALRLSENPALVSRLRDEMDVPLRVIHVVRNPFDHLVARAAARAKRQADASMPHMLETQARLYERVAIVRAEFQDDEWLDVRTEDFVAAPEQSLRSVLAFLGLGADDEWVRAAGGIVMAAPSRRRDVREWMPDERRSVEAEIARHAFLRGYTFDA